MKTKPPPDRRKFAGQWDEINYLCDKLLYWLYQRKDLPKARTYALRLEKLLALAAPNHDGIFGEECWSLVYETKGDIAEAIRRRENEIRLIRRLHEISRHLPNREVATKGYGYDALSDRLDLLAGLYLEVDQLNKAIGLLHESKKLCQTHGIKHDGQDLLRDCLQERERRRRSGRRAASHDRTKVSA